MQAESVPPGQFCRRHDRRAPGSSGDDTTVLTDEKQGRNRAHTEMSHLRTVDTSVWAPGRLEGQPRRFTQRATIGCHEQEARLESAPTPAPPSLPYPHESPCTGNDQSEDEQAGDHDATKRS